MMFRRFARQQRGQSLIEVALMVPLLLLVVVGIVDVGRIYVSKTSVTNAAREAAALAARDPQASKDSICQRARDELGIGGGSCSTPELTVACTRGGAPCQFVSDLDPWHDTTAREPLAYTAGQGGADVTITVTYRITLVSGSLIGRAFSVNPVALSSTAWFPGLSQ
jgi:Flp pilus assembly protein TadG